LVTFSQKKEILVPPYAPTSEKGWFLAKVPSEQADGFMQLTLEPVVVVLEPVSCIIRVVEFDLEDICTFVDPRRIDNAKLVACKGGETAVTLTTVTTGPKTVYFIANKSGNLKCQESPTSGQCRPVAYQMF
jgi:hypothetical protein